MEGEEALPWEVMEEAVDGVNRAVDARDVASLAKGLLDLQADLPGILGKLQSPVKGALVST